MGVSGRPVPFAGLLAARARAGSRIGHCGKVVFVFLGLRQERGGASRATPRRAELRICRDHGPRCVVARVHGLVRGCYRYARIASWAVGDTAVRKLDTTVFPAALSAPGLFRRAALARWLQAAASFGDERLRVTVDYGCVQVRTHVADLRVAPKLVEQVIDLSLGSVRLLGEPGALP